MHGLTNNPPTHDEFTHPSPVGLAFAVECLRFGLHVQVVDKATSKDAWSKAFGLHARTLEHFLGMGILPAVLQEANAVTNVTVRSSIARASYGWGCIQCTYVLLVRFGGPVGRSRLRPSIISSNK